MRHRSTWRGPVVGAKLALGAAVVGGFLALSAPVHAFTHTFAFDDTGALLTANGGVGANALSGGQDLTITVLTSEASGTQWISFTSTDPLHTISTTVQNPARPVPEDPAFEITEAGWFDDPNNAATGTFFAIPQIGNLVLTTSFAAAAVTKYLVFKWSGGINPEGTAQSVSLNTNLSSTVIPLPAGLVLFLSGLAGIGVLGRYKAKRRDPAAA